MHILFLTPYFPPEVGAAQTRIYELAVRLRDLGHQVSVLTTFPNYPSGIVPPEWRGKLRWKGTENGITIHRVWSYAAPNRGFLKRITSQMSFATAASLAVLAMPACDVVIVESPPLFDGFAGLAAAVRGIPYVFTVSDLWPESAIQMGMLKNRMLIRASQMIEHIFYRYATGILALTEGIQRGIVAGGIDRGKVALFRNSVDCEFFHPGLASAAMRAAIAPAGTQFVVLYAGTLGLAQNLGTVLHAAKLAEGVSGVHFVLAGAGADGDILRQEARQLQLHNVTFLDPLPKSRMPELINAADCVLVPLRDLELFRGALPTKMFEAMACEQPIVLGIAGEAAELITTAKAGYCVRPESAPDLWQAIQKLMADRKQAAEMGRRGRAYVVAHFSRDSRARQLSEALESWCGAAVPRVGTLNLNKADKQVGAQ